MVIETLPEFTEPVPARQFGDEENFTLAANTFVSEMFALVTNLNTNTIPGMNEIGSQLNVIYPHIDDLIAAAQSIEDVSIIAPYIEQINAVAADIANIDTVSGSIAYVNAVGSNIPAIVTAADNIDAIIAAPEHAATAMAKAAEAADSAAAALVSETNAALSESQAAGSAADAVVSETNAAASEAAAAGSAADAAASADRAEAITGTTSEAVPYAPVARDADANAKFGTCTDPAHAANKGYVDGELDKIKDETNTIRTWVKRSLPFAGSWYDAAASGQYVYAVRGTGPYGGRSIDGGKTWSVMLVPSGNWRHVIAIDQYVILVPSGAGTTSIARSEDYGATFETVTLPQEFQPSSATNSGPAILLGSSSGVMRSDDYGKTWELSISGTGYNYLSSDGGPLVMAFGGTTNIARRSLDYGVTWEEVVLPSSAAWNSGAMSGQHIVRFGSNASNGAIKSGDSGATWRQITLPVQSQIFSGVAAVGARFVALPQSDDVAIFSDDYGETWDTGPALPSIANWATAVPVGGHFLAFNSTSSNGGHCALEVDMLITTAGMRG